MILEKHVYCWWTFISFLFCYPQPSWTENYTQTIMPLVYIWFPLPLHSNSNLPFSVDVKVVYSFSSICLKSNCQFSRPRNVPLIKSTESWELLLRDLYLFTGVDKFLHFLFAFSFMDMPCKYLQCLLQLLYLAKAFVLLCRQWVGIELHFFVGYRVTISHTTHKVTDSMRSITIWKAL